MFYREYEIVACVQHAELWSLDENGQPRERLGNCPTHEGYSVMYEVVNGSGLRSVSQIASVDSAKAWIDATIVAQTAKES